MRQTSDFELQNEKKLSGRGTAPYPWPLPSGPGGDTPSHTPPLGVFGASILAPSALVPPPFCVQKCIGCNSVCWSAPKTYEQQQQVTDLKLSCTFLQHCQMEYKRQLEIKKEGNQENFTSWAKRNRYTIQGERGSGWGLSSRQKCMLTVFETENLKPLHSDKCCNLFRHWCRCLSMIMNVFWPAT